MDPRWRQSGWGHQVGSVDELTRAVGRIGTLQGGRRYVWRGISNRSFTIRSSLLRRLDVENGGEKFTEERVHERELEILQLARQWGVGIELGITATDLHLLSLLQHHGLPTRLIDVTTNPMTALWFACQPAEAKAQGTGSDSAGALFAFDVTAMPEYATVDLSSWGTVGGIGSETGISLRRALERSAEDQRAFLIRPALPDPRMVAQEGLFIAGATPSSSTIEGVDSFPLQRPPAAPGASALEALFAPEERKPGRPRALPFVVLIIPSNLKSRMLASLRASYSRRRRFLFPDLEGFKDAFELGQLDS